MYFPVLPSVLTKSGRSSLAFMNSGATSVLSSEPTATILHFLFFLNSFGVVVLRFLGDSLTSVIVHSYEK